MPKKPKGGKADDANSKVQLTAADLERMTLEKKAANAPPPAPQGKVDASPVVSPRATPAWGVALPPALDLAADVVDDEGSAGAGAGGIGADGGAAAPAASSSVLDQEAAEAAAVAAAEDQRPVSAELLSMDSAARQAAVDDALARLLSEGLEGNDEGSKEAAASDVAECVRAFGVSALWRYGILTSMKSALEAGPKASEDRVAGALYAVSALIRRCKAWFEPYVLDLLPAVIDCYGHKAASVRDAAAAAATQIIRGLNTRAARMVLPILFSAMESSEWRIKQGACQCVGTLSKHASSQLSIMMPLVVPRVTTCLRDTKKEVAKAARTALIEACSVIGNPDIAPVVPSVISAIKDPDKCPAALEDLMHTTFIHPIDAATLAVIVPILSRSLTSRGGMHEKRKAATVVINMCKLVLNPADVEPFVPKLLPELKRSSEEEAFDEIREVCGHATKTLMRAMGEAGINLLNEEAKNKHGESAASYGYNEEGSGAAEEE